MGTNWAGWWDPRTQFHERPIQEEGKSWWVVGNNSWLWGRGQKHHVDPTPWREYGRWTEQSNIQSGLNWLLGWTRPKTRVLTYHWVRHRWKDNWKQGSPQCRHLSLWSIAVLEDRSKLGKHMVCTSVFKKNKQKNNDTLCSRAVTKGAVKS